MLKSVIRLKHPGLFQRYYEEEFVSQSEALIKPEYGAICKADLRYFYGLRPQEVLYRKLPAALIHEATAVVLHDPTGKYQDGQKVVPVPNTPQAAQPEQTWYTSNYLPESRFRSSGFDGYTQSLLAHRGDLLVPFETKGMDNSQVNVFAEVVSVAVHALQKANKLPINRHRIAIWGDGLMGYVTSLVAKMLFSDSSVYAIIKHPERIDYFDHVHEVLFTSNLPEAFQCDVAIECVGGQASGDAIREIVPSLAPSGVGILAGVTEGPVPVETRMVLERGLTLIGSSRSTKDDFVEAIRLLQDKTLSDKLAQVVSDIIPVRSELDLEKAFRLAGGIDFGKIILKFEL